MSAEITTAERFMASLTALTAMTVVRPLSPEKLELLNQDLPEEEMKILPGKTAKDSQGNTVPVQYVDGHFVIERLNKVFGFDGWSVSYGAMTIIAGDRAVVHVPTTLVAAGVTRTDIGVGVAANEKPDSIETAIKAAFTDGLKRCARTFGASFGLALYDKDRETRAVGFAFEVQEIIALLERAKTAEEFKAADGRMRARWDQSKPEEQTALAAAHEATTKRLAPRGESSKDPPALATYRERCAAAATIDILVATHLELAPTVAQHVEAAKPIIRARAGALGTTPEELGKLLTGASSITKEPQAWATVVKVLAGLAGATDRASVNAVAKQYGAAVGKLPEALKAQMNTARAARIAVVSAPANDDAAAQFEEEIKRAATIPDLEAVNDRITAAVKAGTVTHDQAKTLVALYDKAATALEREVAA
jgi:hypothetical protein